MIAVTLVGLLSISGGCSAGKSKIGQGDTVRYDVNGVSGTGVVVGVQERLEGGKKVFYYKVDAGVDSSGQRDQALLHQNLLTPVK